MATEVRPDASTLQRLIVRVDDALKVVFSDVDSGADLQPLRQAIEYSLLAPGKRVRPALALAAAEIFDGNEREIMPVAVAFELIHAYSLVHDDLPSMDDDDIRRGRPTNHRQFTEATAILVGDALQSAAFECVAQAQLPAQLRIDIVQVLAQSAGWMGMVGGQYLDTADEHVAHDLASVRAIHDRKTGALICGAIECGGIAAGASTQSRVDLRRFGVELGWLFQIVDDLLDKTETTEKLGKPAGSDSERGIFTAVEAAGGIEQLRQLVGQQADTCRELAQQLPKSGGALADIVTFVQSRSM